jgi:ABC-type phosphate transport system substrate-binding protein
MPVLPGSCAARPGEPTRHASNRRSKIVIWVLIAVVAVAAAAALLRGLRRGPARDEVARFHRARELTTGWSRAGAPVPVLADQAAEADRGEADRAAEPYPAVREPSAGQRSAAGVQRAADGERAGVPGAASSRPAASGSAAPGASAWQLSAPGGH